MHATILEILLAVQPGQTPKTEETETGLRTSDFEDFKRWKEYYLFEAKKYEMYLSDGDQPRLRLLERSLLDWTNPVRQIRAHGGLYVWTLDGRPTVVGALATNRFRNRAHVHHQMQSFARGPMVAEHDGKRVWYPRSPGPQPRAVPGVSRPATSASIRLVQMRTIARRFMASGIEPGGKHRLCRLLQTPLLRYQSKSDEVLDGALFCYAMVTDPEMLLLIEARKTDDGLKWCFTPGRFTDGTLKFELDQKKVWEEPVHRYRPHEPYIKQLFPTDRAFFEP